MSGAPTRPTRPVQPLPGWVALWASASAHALALLLGWLLTVPGGDLVAGGEDGRAGAGDDELEISVVEGRLLPAAPSAPPSREPDAPDQPDTPAEPVAPAPTRERPVLAVRASGQGERVPEPTRPEPAEATETAAGSGATPGLAIGHPDGDDATRHGRAPGDPDVAAVILGSVGVGSQEGARVLLQRALECSDPIEGVWVSHRYSPEFHDWARMTLRIDRDGDQLRGTIHSRAWTGLASDRRPPPCAEGAHDVTVRMEARGWVRGEQISFGADTHRISRVDCPSGFFAYNPDSFTGRLDTLREELDTLNNDGGRDVNAPYRFRRTACLEE